MLVQEFVVPWIFSEGMCGTWYLNNSVSVFGCINNAFYAHVALICSTRIHDLHTDTLKQKLCHYLMPQMSETWPDRQPCKKNRGWMADTCFLAARRSYMFKVLATTYLLLFRSMHVYSNTLRHMTNIEILINKNQQIYGLYLQKDALLDPLISCCLCSSPVTRPWRRRTWPRDRHLCVAFIDRSPTGPANWSGRRSTNMNLVGGFKYSLFSPRKLGKWSKLTNIFVMGWNHQLGTDWLGISEASTICPMISTSWNSLVSQNEPFF